MKAIVLNELDNVATAVVDIALGEPVEVRVGPRRHTVKVMEAVPFGFKFSIRTIPKGEAVYKYGKPLGHSTQQIEEGVVVHNHNMQ